MKRYYYYYILLFFVFSTQLFSQEHLTLEKIWGGAFRTERLKAITHLDNNIEFSYLSYDHATKSTAIIGENYSNGKKRVLLESSDIGNLPITGYSFSKNYNAILLETENQPRYRYSSKGKYVIYNFKKNTQIPLTEEWVLNPSLSPDGNKSAFVKNNNLFIKDLNTRTLTQLTKDGKENGIINGLSDWVYEEEFELVKAYAWSPDSQKIVFLKFDESKVKEYQMPIYNAKSNYPTYQHFKYPKAGEENSIVKAFLYDLESGKTTEIKLPETPYYIPRLQWKNAGNIVFQTLNRHQNFLKIWNYNTNIKSTSLLYSEKDTAYIEIDNHLTFCNEGFYLTSEKSGFNHIYFQSNKGALIQLTKGEFEVTKIYGFDPQTKSIFYQSNEGNEIERQVYKIDIEGNKTQITAAHGTHDGSFSKDFTFFVNRFSNNYTPPTYKLTLVANGKVIKTLKNNTSLKEI